MSRPDEEASKRKGPSQSADALDDGLDYEVDSDDAGDMAIILSASEGSDNSDDEGVSESEVENNGVKSSKEEKVAKKVVSPEERKRKRKERKAITKKRKLEELGDGEEADSDVSMNTDQQADLFARLIRDHASKDLTSIELSDKYISSSVFVDSSDFKNARNLSTVGEFIEKYTGREDLKSANKEVGRPHTLLLASSAIRVADLVRSLKYLKTKTAEPAKLFGKEKIATQTAWLEKTRVNVAIGVPGRVLSLVAASALKLERLEQIYIDHTYKDPKKRGLVQIKEVTADLVKILEHEVLRRKLEDGTCKIVLF